MLWVVLLCRPEGRPAAALRSWIKPQFWLGDLSSFPWAHWFFSHITDNCWMLWILSSPSWRGEEPLQRVDMRVAISDLRKVIFWHLIDCDWRLCASCPCNECIFNGLWGELSSCLLGFYFTNCKLASLKYNCKLWPEHVLLLNNALNVELKEHTVFNGNSSFVC